MPVAEALETIGNVTPETRAIAARVIRALESTTPYRVTVTWGYDPDEANPEHHTGRAVDFMCSQAAGKWISQYLWDHRAEFGLVHEIHLQRIRSTKVEPGKWRKMEDRGTPTNNHMDHVHALFDGTARTIPPRPAVTRTPTAPAFPGKPGSYYGPRAKGGNPGPSRYLAQWQKQMQRRGWKIAADGLYGPETRAVALAFGKEKNVPGGSWDLIGPHMWAAAWLEEVTR